MNLKPNITALLHKIRLHDSGLRERQLIHPRRDWLIGLLLAVIVFCGAGWWAATTYFNNNDIEAVEVTSSTGQVVYRAQLIAETLLLYDSRKQIFAQLLNQTPEVQTKIQPETLPPDTEVATTTATTSDAVTDSNAPTSEQEEVTSTE